ncbi:peptidase family C78-domain-containing protein [Pisolithus croceorrhizus]|nr:peptidase family C78-domain-containing protein [Pisolithus croceorrhizus]
MEDEVEIIGENSRSTAGNNDICQLCSSNLQDLSPEQRDQHYEDHHIPAKKPLPVSKRRLSRKSAASPSSSKPRSRGVPCFQKGSEERFWYPTLSEPPPANYTPGLLSILKEALKKSNLKGYIDRAVLCYDRTPHITPTFDRGWGCGYRNFLMACAALMDQQIQPSYLGCLESPIPPGVCNLQQWIEDAWKEGYDEIGAEQLDNRLVGTKKFIGTAELYVAFSSRGIPCILVDFDFGSSQGQLSLHGKSLSILSFLCRVGPLDGLQGTVNDALRDGSPVITTEKMPVILQFEGHSVTVVGYEVQSRTREVNLLVFDPSSTIFADVRSAALAGSRSVTWTSASKISRALQVGQRKLKGSSRKRARLESDGESAIVISDSDDEEKAGKANGNLTLRTASLIKAFRWKKLVLKKHKAFQLLYFPMDKPLSQQERMYRQVVSSTLG